MFTLEESILLNLSKSSITGAPFEMETQGADWESICREAAVQSVALMLFDAVAGVKDRIPQEVFAPWQQLAYKKLVKNTKVQAAQKELVALLGSHPYVILKGAAAAAYYPKPELRQMGDVDFLIDPARLKELSALLENAGYQKFMENHACHVVFKKPGAHLEMHFEPAGIPHGEAGEKVRAFLNPCVHHPKEEAGFSAPQPMYHGLILLLHMQHHMLGEGLGLRHLCDWACFVQETHSEPFWAELISFLKEIGLFTYMNIMTALCSAYFGISTPSWMVAVEEPLLEAVMVDTFKSGNFGRKDRQRAAGGMMISNRGKDGTSHSKFYYLYQTLHASTLEQSAAARKNRILAFFIDCGRGVRYLWKSAKGERYSLLKLMPEADERKKLYDQFQLFK